MRPANTALPAAADYDGEEEEEEEDVTVDDDDGGVYDELVARGEAEEEEGEEEEEEGRGRHPDGECQYKAAHSRSWSCFFSLFLSDQKHSVPLR